MMVLAKTELQKIVNRLLGPLPGPIEQRNVKRAFGGHVVRRYRFEYPCCPRRR